MLRHFRRIVPLGLVLLLGLNGACRFFSDHGERIPNGNSNTGGIGGGEDDEGNLGEGGPKAMVTFTPVGPDFGVSGLIDLEFLPGQNGEAIVISKSGSIFYLDADLIPLPEVQTLFVEDDGERGLLNVIADPEYTENAYVYFYYTVGGISPDLNRVRRYTVQVDIQAGTFELLDPLLIIQFSKSESPNPASNHNGGSLAFDVDGNLLIGVGDGGGGASANQSLQISQDLDLRLGKIHRILPERDPFPTPTPTPGVEHFAVPDGQGVSSEEPSIFALGFRNPFSSVLQGGEELWVGDVGLNTFEEIDLVQETGDNFGWPQCEGACENPEFQDPVHGYAHDDDTFIEEDPAGVSEESRSVVVLAHYQGDQYEGLLTDRLIYTDFFLGWVRAIHMNESGFLLQDKHIGHQPGLTSLQTHPVDGLLYGVSPSGPDRLLKVELKTP